jgi:hypothetical protein
MMQKQCIEVVVCGYFPDALLTVISIASTR